MEITQQKIIKWFSFLGSRELLEEFILQPIRTNSGRDKTHSQTGSLLLPN